MVQSFFPSLRVNGKSRAEDVLKMQEALQALARGESCFDCGEAGTVLRFLALRVSREAGVFELQGSRRLFERPQEELARVLRQLGVTCRLEESKMTLESGGWRPQGDTLLVPCGKSSQFLSAVVLSAWRLPFDLYVSPENLSFSKAYYQMTRRFLEEIGMTFKDWDQDFCVLKNQELKAESVDLEPDMSSCFALAAVAAVSGQMVLTDFPQESLQPDFYFLQILKTMGVPVDAVGGRLKVLRAAQLEGVRVSLKDCPDLFPVLSALCALAEGPSELRGAPHLRFKESSRIEKIKELLEKAGSRVLEHEDGLSITPSKDRKSGFVFDAEGDHRLAMAAAVLLKAGYEFDLRSPQVVSKSFPEFWTAVGMEN